MYQKPHYYVPKTTFLFTKTTKLFTYIAKDTIFSLGKQKCGL